jgi:hypothetical protein
MKRSPFRLSRFPRIPPKHRCRATAICAAIGLLAGNSWAQLQPNQTQAFGNGRLLIFTYLQNFDCVDQPLLDLDFDGIPAESDPDEMQTPICQVVTEPSQDPTGGNIKHTAHLYVLVPMFGTDMNPGDAMQCPPPRRPGELCGAALGKELIALFHHLPEAWRAKPAVPTQCPDPSDPVPGTCTMHASSVDLSVLLAGMPGIPNPPKHPIFVPTPNHDHIVDNSRVNARPIWWEVRPVLIMDSRDWPTADGSTGITSSRAMDQAEAAGTAVEVGSNFFLFFSSRMAMPGM